MNVLILTNPEHENFVHDTLDKLDYRDGLIIVINNKGDFEKFISSFSYDIGISFMYLYKVPAEEVNSHTWINFHPGPLPEYKGRNLCYHAIMNGESEFGATVHYMDENFDTGDIIEVSYFPVLDWYTAKDLSDKTIERSMQQFREYLPRILEGEKFERKKNIWTGVYYKKEKIEDKIMWIDDMEKRHIKAIYCPPYYPRIEIGGVMYKIVKDE